jgi:hypothetical protein
MSISENLAPSVDVATYDVLRHAGQLVAGCFG